MSKLEFMPYVTVTAMSAQGARDFFGGSWFKTLCVGQDTRPGKRFGARVYKLFRTAADWKRYQNEQAACAGSIVSTPADSTTLNPTPVQRDE